MERANTFIVEGTQVLRELADNCAKLYNEVNFERRQSYKKEQRGLEELLCSKMA